LSTEKLTNVLTVDQTYVIPTFQQTISGNMIGKHNTNGT